MTRYRDEALGSALRALETPEHAPGFYTDLHRRLEQERAARRADVRRRRLARRGGLRWGVRVVFAAAVAAAVWLVARLPRTRLTWCGRSSRRRRSRRRCARPSRAPRR